jgi:hypothetical protein
MRTSIAAVVIGLVATGGGCGGREPAPAPVSATAIEGEPAATPTEVVDDAACAGAAMRIEVTPPGDDPSATFAFRRSGDGYRDGKRGICLVRAAERTIVPLDERHEVTIRADATALQRIVVWGRPHLVNATPGSTIMLGDNPCFGYELDAPGTYVWAVPAPLAYCASPGGNCRAGFTRAEPPRPVEDELCGATDPEIRRCVALAEVALAVTPHGAKARDPADAFEATPLLELAAAPLRFGPRTCGFPLIATGREEAALVIGAGARWTLAADDQGRLTGQVQRR